MQRSRFTTIQLRAIVEHILRRIAGGGHPGLELLGPHPHAVQDLVVAGAHLHLEAAQGVGAVLRVVGRVVLSEHIDVHHLVGLGRIVGVQKLGGPEALLVHHALGDGRGHVGHAMGLAAAALDVDPLAIGDAVLLGIGGMDPHLGHRVNLAQVGNIAQGAVVVHGQASLGEHERVLGIGQGRLGRLLVVAQRLVVGACRRQHEGRLLGTLRPRSTGATQDDVRFAVHFQFLGRGSEALGLAGILRILGQIGLIGAVLLGRGPLDNALLASILPAHLQLVQVLLLLLVLVLVERGGHAGRLVEGLRAVLIAQLRALLHDLGPDDALFHGLEQMGDRLAHDDGVQLRNGEVGLQPLGGWKQQVGAEHREGGGVHEALHHVVQLRHDLIETRRVAEHHVLVARPLDPHMDLVRVAILHGLEHRGDVRHIPAQDALVLDGAAALHHLLLGKQARRVAQLVLAGGRGELLEHSAGLFHVAHEELEVEGSQRALLGLHVLVDAHALHDAGLAVRVGVYLQGALDLARVEPADLGALLERPLLAGLLEQLAARGALHPVYLEGAEQRCGHALVERIGHHYRRVARRIPDDIILVGAGKAGLGGLQRETRLGVDEIGHVRPSTAELLVVLLILQNPARPGEQQGGIGAGADGQPHLGLGGVQGVARVDDNRAQPLRTVAQLGQGATARGHRGIGRIGAPQHQGRHGTVGVIVVPTVGVGEGQVVGLAGAVGQKRCAHAGQVALRAAVWGRI